MLKLLGKQCLINSFHVIISGLSSQERTSSLYLQIVTNVVNYIHVKPEKAWKGILNRKE